MLRALIFVLCLAPVAALAQPAGSCPASPAGGQATPCGPMTHGHRMEPGRPMMQGQSQMHGQGVGAPSQPGQGAFAAIREIVSILEADPKTDWSRVNIDALRQHLVDMNNVTLSATVKSVPVDDGIRFEVTGEGPVRNSIRRMTMAHAATMNGIDGWRFEAAEIDGGAALTVHAPPNDRNKLRGLGFFGVLTLGMHHQMHHLMIARGDNPHE